MNTRKRIIRVVLGVLIILVGIAILGNALNLWDIDIFPKGWWALALAVVFFVDIINDGPNFVNIFGMVVFGLVFAKNYLTILADIDWWVLVVACAVVAFGIKLIRDAVTKTDDKSDDKSDD